MFDGMQHFFGDVQDRRFASVQGGPARTLNACLKALRRGDAALVLTSQRRAERAAILAQIVRLAGPDLRRTVRLSGAEVRANLPQRLLSEGIIAAPPALSGKPLSHPHLASPRVLLVIDDAEMLPPAAISMLADLREDATGGPVQVLLAGSGSLIVTMCEPRCDRMWRRVRLALSLEGVAEPAHPQIAVLEQEIARTQARLEAQRRILSIFAESDPRAAPRN